MKILHVVTSFGIGGAEAIAFQLATLQAREHDVSVLAVRGRLTDSDPISLFNIARLRSAGCHLRSGWAVSNYVSLISTAWRLVRMHRKHHFDIVHAHTDIPDMSVSIASRFQALSVVRTIHNTALWPTRPLSAQVCESAFRDDLVVAIGNDTDAAYSALRTRFCLPPSPNRTTIPNAVEQCPALSPGAAKIRAQLQGSSRIKLLFLGRLEAQKGFDVLVEALARISAEKLKGAELHVIGSGSLEPQIAEIENLVTFTHGPIANAASLLGDFDLVLCPSRFEGIGLVPLEAKAQGIPVILSDGPGICETFPNDWPLVSSAGDPNSLQIIIELALQNLATYKRAAQSLKDIAPYTPDTMARKYEAAYVRFLIERNRPVSAHPSYRTIM